MRDWQGRRYWLVGASEGLGLALARKLSAAGVEVVLSARNADRLADAMAQMPGRASAVPCDVASTASVRAAAEQVGQVDGVVFLAGIYWPMRAQDWDADAVEAMCDINLTGCARVMGAVGYGAGKAGVMSLAESMHMDLQKTGVEVQLVNPGFIRTRLTDMNDFTMPQIMEPDAAAQVMFEHMTAGGFSRSFPTPFQWVFRLSQFLPDWAYYRLFGR